MSAKVSFRHDQLGYALQGYSKGLSKRDFRSKISFHDHNGVICLDQFSKKGIHICERVFKGALCNPLVEPCEKKALQGAVNEGNSVLRQFQWEKRRERE